MLNNKKHKLLFASLGVVLAAILPLFLDSYYLHIAVTILFWAYLGACWNILGGFAGQFSFGHSAFFGVGAYISSLLFVGYGISPWIGMLAGAVLACCFGLFIGYLCFRFGLKGAYFALSMLACAGILYVVTLNLKFAKGAMGVLLPIGNSFWSYQFDSRVPYYYIILAFNVFIIAITLWIRKKKKGYYFIAIREDEESAAALGVNIQKYKMIAMGMSSFTTALGGTFYAQYYSYIDPDLAFGSHVSVDILLRPIVGGVGTVWGPLVGSLLLSPLSELSRGLFREYSGLHIMIFGAVLIFVTIMLPKGVVGLFAKRKK